MTGIVRSAPSSCMSSRSTPSATASRLLAALERFAARHGVPRLWVFTEHAAAFYERCGWQRHGEAVEHGEPGVVLTRGVAMDPVRR